MPESTHWMYFGQISNSEYPVLDPEIGECKKGFRDIMYCSLKNGILKRVSY